MLMPFMFYSVDSVDALNFYHVYPESTDLAHTVSFCHKICQKYHNPVEKFMGPIWGPAGSCLSQMNPVLAPWTLLSGKASRLAGITGDTILRDVAT